MFEQHPFEATQIPAARHCLGVAPPQMKPQLLPSQVAVAPAGGAQGSQLLPQVMIELLFAQAPAQMC